MQTGLMFKKLNAAAIVETIELLLQEKSVLITGPNHQYNSQILLELLAYLYPYPYPYPYFATLPHEFIHVFHGPVPVFAATPLDVIKNSVQPPNLHILYIDPSYREQSGYLKPKELTMLNLKLRFALPRAAI